MLERRTALPRRTRPSHIFQRLRPAATAPPISLCVQPACQAFAAVVDSPAPTSDTRVVKSARSAGSAEGQPVGVSLRCVRGKFPAHPATTTSAGRAEPLSRAGAQRLLTKGRRRRPSLWTPSSRTLPTFRSDPQTRWGDPGWLGKGGAQSLEAVSEGGGSCMPTGTLTSHRRAPALSRRPGPARPRRRRCFEYLTFMEVMRQSDVQLDA